MRRTPWLVTGRAAELFRKVFGTHWLDVPAQIGHRRCPALPMALCSFFILASVQICTFEVNMDGGAIAASSRVSLIQSPHGPRDLSLLLIGATSVCRASSSPSQITRDRRMGLLAGVLFAEARSSIDARAIRRNASDR